MLTRRWQDLVFGYVLLFVLRSLWNTDVLICGTIARSTGDVCYYCNTQYRLFFSLRSCTLHMVHMVLLVLVVCGNGVFYVKLDITQWQEGIHLVR